jgi:hypothetical protein
MAVCTIGGQGVVMIVCVVVDGCAWLGLCLRNRCDVYGEGGGVRGPSGARWETLSCTRCIVSVDTAPPPSQSALRWACDCGAIDVATLLLDNGANVHGEPLALPPVLVALRNGDRAMVALLRSRGAELHCELVRQLETQGR